MELRRRWWALVLILAVVIVPARTAAADHLDDHGTIVGGVSNETEAVAYPCPRSPDGDYATTGPVVCVTKRASVWSLTWEHDGYSCSYGPAGWTGSCIFDNDMGDYIKVWGTRGIPDTNFTVHWGHSTAPSAAEPTPGAGASPPPGGGSGGGSDGYAGGSGPSSPEPPTAPDYPDYPDDPEFMTGAPANPGEPVAPRLPDMPDLAVDPGAWPDGPGSEEPSGQREETAAVSERARGDSGTPWVPVAIAGALVATAAGGAALLNRRRA